MNRRLPNPYLDERQPGSLGKIIIRILLIAAAVFALLVPAMRLLPGERLFIWYWVYIAALGLPIILLLAALAVKLHTSIRSKTPRMIATILSGFVVMVAVVVVYSLCSVYTQIGMNPAAYYTNPNNGNRLVIMKAVDFENSSEEERRTAYYYGAFPMSGKLFYYPLRGDMMSTATGIDYVEWSDDGMIADVHIRDREDVEQIISVNFDLSIPVQLPEEPTEEAAE